MPKSEGRRQPHRKLVIWLIFVDVAKAAVGLTGILIKHLHNRQNRLTLSRRTEQLGMSYTASGQCT